MIVKMNYMVDHDLENNVPLAIRIDYAKERLADELAKNHLANLFTNEMGYNYNHELTTYIKANFVVLTCDQMYKLLRLFSEFPIMQGEIKEILNEPIPDLNAQG